MFHRTQIEKKSWAIVFDFSYSFHRIFAIEQFKIRHWKAIGHTNLMISKHLKIRRLQPEKLRNVFERIQIVKKGCVCTVQYVLSNPNTLLLTSRSLVRKVQKLVLTLNLTQEPKNAMRPREVRLQKGPCGWGLISSKFDLLLR